MDDACRSSLDGVLEPCCTVFLDNIERALAVDSAASSTPEPAGPMVSIYSLCVDLKIVDVASILRLDRDIASTGFGALQELLVCEALRKAKEPMTLQPLNVLCHSLIDIDSYTT